MRALLVAAVLLLLTPVGALAQTLTVTNAEGRVTILSPATLADLPRAEARLGGKAVYQGVSLTAVLREAGVIQGPRLHGKPMAAFVVITGKDGYRAVLSIAEIDPSFRDAPIILADRMGQGPLADNEGPWRLVIDADARPDRGVRQVESIRVVLAP
ncbi:MAG: molybdopterin-dependent oxidoreductase [Caulobacter sp.]|nr:molybdopterin-dependent oxidoreductase [Caulobacter sp.]